MAALPGGLLAPVLETAGRSFLDYAMLAAREADGTIINWLSAEDVKRVASVVNSVAPDKEIVFYCDRPGEATSMKIALVAFDSGRSRVGVLVVIHDLTLAFSLFGFLAEPTSLAPELAEFRRTMFEAAGHHYELQRTLEDEIRVEEQKEKQAASKAEQDSAIAAGTLQPVIPSTPPAPEHETVTRTSTGTSA